jgi:site-specific DNA-methyltransferase (adenine-specific)
MATLLKGDCLEVMKSLPNKSIDCFICDLPYGCLTGGGITKVETAKEYGRTGKEGISGCAWDVKLNLADFWTQVKRLAKDDHTPVLMFCNTKFGYDLIKSNESWFRYDLVWDKGHGVSFLLANKMPMKSHEMVYVFSKKGAFYRRVDVEVADNRERKRTGGGGGSTQYGGANRTDTPNLPIGFRCPLSVIPIGGKSAGGHPTEKPLDLYRWLLERYVPDKGTVVDPTAGSFNAIIAAQSLGYKAIGIEKDDAFFWKAVQKLRPQPAPATTSSSNTLHLVS